MIDTLPALRDESDLAVLTTEDLRDEFRRCLGFTAQGFLHCARILQILRGRQEDVDDLAPKTFIRWLERIAQGRLLPEMVASHFDDSGLVKIAMGLPSDDQKRIASGAPVKLVVYGSHEGEYTHLMVDPRTLTSTQRRQVFARDHIRDEAEQRAALESERTKARLRKPVRRIGPMDLDKEIGGVNVLKRCFISLAQLKEAIRELER